MLFNRWTTGHAKPLKSKQDFSQFNLDSGGGFISFTFHFFLFTCPSRIIKWCVIFPRFHQFHGISSISIRRFSLSKHAYIFEQQRKTVVISRCTTITFDNSREIVFSNSTYSTQSVQLFYRVQISFSNFNIIFCWTCWGRNLHLSNHSTSAFPRNSFDLPIKSPA